MKILFAPSEAKNSGGITKKLSIVEFALQKKQKEHVANLYNRFLKNASDTELKKLFGIKKEFDRYTIDIFDSPLLPAIERYTGVAYDHLNVESLDENAKAYLKENLIIFSNIFGAIKAYELIPEYKLKQGEKIDGFNIETYYKKFSTKELDEYFEGEIIVDLRAGFYEKFYIPNREYITMKFLKNGKVVSHWAKAYRGKIVRELAKHRPQTIDELNKIEFEELKIYEIKSIKLKREYVFEIVE